MLGLAFFFYHVVVLFIYVLDYLIYFKRQPSPGSGVRVRRCGPPRISASLGLLALDRLGTERHYLSLAPEHVSSQSPFLVIVKMDRTLYLCASSIYYQVSVLAALNQRVSTASLSVHRSAVRRRGPEG